MSIREILSEYKNIYVLGISPKKDRDSYRVAKYMKDQNYNVIGIRPNTEKIEDIPCVSSISDIPSEIEILDVFRASEHIPQIVDEAIKHSKVKVLWLQLGISHPEAEEKAKKAGIKVITDHCIKVEHQKLSV
ncbi:MAG: CoA-binding protein [Bdellovibrionaceae bacterium]|nr:CoA-binding protein [Pseudobdellovibrionaceae bacterium]|tara:strand:- start:52230 stop:52625 length:396 start_codon:yes stop_codon:yes gene_type:complete